MKLNFVRGEEACADCPVADPELRGDLAQAVALRLQLQNPCTVYRTLRTAQLLAIHTDIALSDPLSDRVPATAPPVRSLMNRVGGFPVSNLRENRNANTYTRTDRLRTPDDAGRGAPLACRRQTAGLQDRKQVASGLRGLRALAEAAPERVLRTVNREDLKGLKLPGGHVRVDPADLVVFWKYRPGCDGQDTALRFGPWGDLPRTLPI
jgi:hypothetical protein